MPLAVLSSTPGSGGWRSPGVRAERMARWVEETPHAVLRLVHGQRGPERDSSLRLGLQVDHLKVEMQHRLMLTWLGRPRRGDVAIVLLDTQVRHALTRVQRGVLIVEMVERPTEAQPS